MRILYAQHLDPSLRYGYEQSFNRDLKQEIIDMTRISIKSTLKFYDDIHLYVDDDSKKYFDDLPITLHTLHTLPSFFCGAKLEVLKDQKDLDFLWVDPDIFVSTPFDIKEGYDFMVDKSTTLNDYYYERLSYFSKKNPKYKMVREWLNSGILWFGNMDSFNYHVNLYEELMKISSDARIVESWNISHCGEKFKYGTFQHSNTEYLHFDGYKKFYDVTKKMIKGLEQYL
jgi:hypothetical protein